VDSIVAYLAWVSGIENHDWPPQHSEQRWKRSTDRILAAAALSPAAALVKQEDCLTCHALGSLGERKGPRFEWIGKRRSARWIAEYLGDPEAMAPGAEMPSYSHLSQAQRQMIAEFVVSLSKPEGR